ncbi:UDP-3-O-(3-hydroxymyristoyl)glucosamine N-acyltransferase [candidate division KSB3 bacterium]|uniref:UDP-3-O-acylglucosamine N-acyltransferase n=1 Tax=candidate division KSB3 bacterium TaxID=2044937 RepID=A0A2G6E0W8_9BACT|nr:MAG: UDP-3-O-(3-hydroxymyristoyl)glucosamine N-acyltransferase [candidate division KSB3 bacterium]
MKTIALHVVAELVQGTLEGDGDITISGMNGLEAAGSEEITFLAHAKEAARLTTTKAACALVPLDLTDPQPLPVIRVANPYLASAIVHNKLLEREFQATGIHPRAFVGDDCQIADEVSVGPLVAIGNRVVIGQRVTLEPGVVIGDDVMIGDDCVLKANVSIAERCKIGNRVIIHSGTVIGSDGYGYATDAMGNHIKRPQVGTVRIDDVVEIGAGVTIDRGAFGETWIQSGGKIDNQVHLAHNVVVGPNALLVAQVGIAGSTTLGRNVVLGGQTAVKDHIQLGDRVMAAARSGIHNSQPDGAQVGGAPAIPVKIWGKATAVFAKLPEMYRELRALKKAVAALEKRFEK